MCDQDVGIASERSAERPPRRPCHYPVAVAVVAHGRGKVVAFRSEHLAAERKPFTPCRTVVARTGDVDQIVRTARHTPAVRRLMPDSHPMAVRIGRNVHVPIDLGTGVIILAELTFGRPGADHEVVAEHGYGPTGSRSSGNTDHYSQNRPGGKLFQDIWLHFCATS